MPSKLPVEKLIRIAVTVVVVLIACFFGNWMWSHYENDPWTRDGRIKADTVQVAPDVTGPVVKVYVQDNQHVKIGDVLFEIDQSRFKLALQQAQAAEQAAQVVLQQAIREVKRNAALKELVSHEEREQTQSRMDQARTALARAVVERETAQLNLDRTRIYATVNGVVTNLDLQNGSYVTASKPVMALVDRDSFYVEGYFEETKLPKIHIGDEAIIKLTGENKELIGQVDSITRGVADSEHSTNPNLLKKVNPAFNWVRLVQRIPVRISIKSVPEGVRLVAGQTASIEINPVALKNTAIQKP